MRRWIAPILILLLLFLALAASRSILKARLLELRIAIQRDQILRYELSSRLLRYRFKQMLEDRENVRNEIKLSVLESHVVNDLSRDIPEPELMEESGARLINAVRWLSLKPTLNILEKRVKILHLHSGFFHERNRNCPAALKGYASFDTSEESPDSAFVMLHTGYCLAVTGKVDEAIATLESVETRYPGTHFERSAREIIELLRGMRETTRLASTQSDEEAAETLFQAGQFWQVDKLLAGKARTGRQRYILARSKEEMGQTSEAVQIYREVAASGDEYGRAANRRLLLMGTIYNQGTDLAKEAEDRAQRTGDHELVQEVKQAVTEQKPAAILNVRESDEGNAKIVAEIREEIQKREAAIQAAPPVEQPPGLEVLLSDGRRLPGTSILIEDDRAILASARPVAIPSVLILSIQLAPQNAKYMLCAVDKSRKMVCGSTVSVKDGNVVGNSGAVRLSDLDAVLVQKGAL